MNFLAHLFLSGKDDGIKIGGFIADSVKGRDYNDYPESIKKGILIHRSIDEFTDHHHIVMSCNHLLRKSYKKYSGIVTDIFFDHFLSSNWSNYSSEPLNNYAEKTYKLLTDNINILPDRVKTFLPFVIQNNWLVLYGTIAGIEKVLERMPNRTTLPRESEEGIKILKDNYNLFRNYFNEFFYDAINYVESTQGIKLIQGIPSIG